MVMSHATAHLMPLACNEKIIIRCWQRWQVYGVRCLDCIISDDGGLRTIPGPLQAVFASGTECVSDYFTFWPFTP